MKTLALFLSGLLLSALLSDPAAAASVRVKVTARVTDVSDTGNVLAGKIVFGQRLSGTYVYNTNTPNESPAPGTGHYRPYANEARMRFVSGSFVFENVQPTQSIDIFVTAQTSGTGQFLMQSFENKPLANGANVENIRLELIGNGNVTVTEALANAAPDLPQYPGREITINGNGSSGSFFVRARIEVAELIVADAIEVSPASGTFIPNQQFDAALLLPRNSVVANAHALANGALLPLTYPGSCQLRAPNSAGRPSLLCPNASAALPIGASAPIEWTVELTNGTVLTETVSWEIVP